MYAQHFHDNLTWFADALIEAHPADAWVTTGADLLEPETLSALVDAHAASEDCADRRAASSQWSKWALARLIVSVVVVQLGENRRLDIDLDDLSLAWRADATLDTIVCPRRAFIPGEASDLSALIDRVLTPLVLALSAQCRLAPRVFWSNAASYFEWALGELADQGRFEAGSLQRLSDLLGCTDRPDGGFNPFAHCSKVCAPGALDGNGAPIARCRRMCCMRDLDTKWGLCSNCPRAVHFDVAESA